MHFAKKKQTKETNPLFKDKNHNKITFKRGDFNLIASDQSFPIDSFHIFALT